MGLVLDRDYKVFDEGDPLASSLGTVEYQVHTGNGGYTTAIPTVTSALRIEVLETEGAPSFGVYEIRDCKIELPIQQFTSVVPKIGDRIIEQGLTWNVREVRKPVFGDYWGFRCRTMRLIDALAFHADYYGSILEGPGLEFSTDVYAAHIKQLALRHSQLKCHFQPIVPQVVDFMDKRGLQYNYNVYTEVNIMPSYGDYFLRTDEAGFENVKYKIVSWRSLNTIDNLLELHCMRTV
jgi:hypothetical protein